MAAVTNAKRQQLPTKGAETEKSLESWIWDAAKYKEFILPLISAKRLCDVFADELNHVAQEVGSREKAFKLVKRDKRFMCFYLPLEPFQPGQNDGWPR